MIVEMKHKIYRVYERAQVKQNTATDVVLNCRTIFIIWSKFQFQYPFCNVVTGFLSFHQPHTPYSSIQMFMVLKGCQCMFKRLFEAIVPCAGCDDLGTVCMCLYCWLDLCVPLSCMS